MIDSSIDIGVKKIVYVKHWLRSLSLLFFRSVVYLYLFVINCMLSCHNGEIKLYNSACLAIFLLLPSFLTGHYASCTFQWNLLPNLILGLVFSASFFMGVHSQFHALMLQAISCISWLYDTIRYDTIRYDTIPFIYVRSKADEQLAHSTKNGKNKEILQNENWVAQKKRSG